MNDEHTFKHTEHQAEGFNTWMQREETKMFLSLLPPSLDETQQETLRVVLRSAFYEGFNIGAASVAMTILERMLSEPSPKA